MAEAFVVAALLHDLGHWPFCHPIEDMRLSDLGEHESIAAAGGEEDVMVAGRQGHTGERPAGAIGISSIRAGNIVSHLRRRGSESEKGKERKKKRKKKRKQKTNKQTNKKR